MRFDLSASLARGLSVGMIGFALLGSTLVSAPAQAMPSPGGASPAVCLTPTSSPTKWRETADTTPVTAATKEKVDAALASYSTTASTSGLTSPLARTAVTATPREIHVPVVIHVIRGRHRADRVVSRVAARRLFYTLRAGYNGRQDPTMTPTGVLFELNRITITRNDRWFHAAPFSRADKQMKRHLHLGKARVLNIYINSPRLSGQLLLGFSLFPWQRAAYPLLDGVTVSEAGIRGGRARGYNLGDTVIHETGHWLGLLHTFEGGCEGDGDGVADTPAEGEPSFTCPIGRNTCPDPDLPPVNPGDPPIPNPVPDPVTNFMDYSYDSCMNHFTDDQSLRMRTAFMRYRYGR